MELIYLLRGIAIGFSLAAPVGPIGVLCIRRTLAYGSRRGLFVGFGAASADMMYGIVAAFGVTLISNFISLHMNIIRIAGGILLLVLGIRSMRSHPATDTPNNNSNGYIRTFFSVFILTLTNPMTLFAFAAVFAGIGLESVIGNHSLATFLVIGVFIGSMSWFSLLTALVHFFREKISHDGIALVNKIAGALLIIFGLIALWSGIFGF